MTIQLRSMMAIAIRGIEHGGVVPPKAQGIAVIPCRVGRERPACETSIALLQPIKNLVHVAPKIDNALQLKLWAKSIACSRDNHHHAPGISRCGLKYLARALAIKVVALAMMPNRQKQLVPGFHHAAEVGHEGFLVFH